MYIDGTVLATGQANDMLSRMRALDRAVRLPRVRAVHLPRDTGGKQSAFCALELDGGVLGLAYVSLGATRQNMEKTLSATALVGTDPLELVAACASDDAALRTLGFATVNALTRFLFDRAGFEPPVSADSFGGLHIVARDRVGMVGYFEPLVGRLVAAGAVLTVLELRPELAGCKDSYRVTLDAAQLAGCDKIICTSTVLLNDTLDDVLGRCAAARAFALVGPGAGCLPDPLFERGVTHLGGSWILDSAGVIEALAEGRPWSAYVRKFDLDQATYPGFDALLERARR